MKPHLVISLHGIRPSIPSSRGLLAALPIAALCLAGCFGALMGPGLGDPTQASDSAVANNVTSAKAEAEANPGDTQKAVAYAELLGAAFQGGTVARGRLDGQALVPDALEKLDGAAVAHPDDAAMLTAVKGNLFVRSGQTDEGVAQYEASMAIEPNLYALVPLIEVYAAARRHDDIDAHCQATRKSVSEQDRLYTLLRACASARPGMTGAQALPWASRKDVAFYEEQRAIDQARAEAEKRAEAERQAELLRQREQEEAARRAAAASNPSPASTGGSSGSGHYSANVSVHNGCSQQVRIFRGRVNGSYTGSGTYGWHGVNTTSSYHLSGDDELCIVENDRNIVSCTKPQNGARLEITSSCSGFARR